MRVRPHNSQPHTPHSAPAGRSHLRLVGGRASEATPRGDEFAAERRLRDAGGPDDSATYTCECGLVFEADVSTSVSCPQCGSDQAW